MDNHTLLYEDTRKLPEVFTKSEINKMIVTLETSPDYLHSKSGSCSTGQITALIKLAYTPVSVDTDLVLIENEEALADIIQSIKYREKGDASRSIQWEKDAFRELNYELKDRFPQEQFNFDFRPFGSDTLQRQKIGALM